MIACLVAGLVLSALLVVVLLMYVWRRSRVRHRHELRREAN